MASDKKKILPQDCNHETFVIRSRTTDAYGSESDEGYYDGHEVICGECGCVLRHYVPQEVANELLAIYLNDAEWKYLAEHQEDETSSSDV